MASVRWTLGALSDFQRELSRFKSYSAAQQFRDRVDAAVVRLELFPFSRRSIPEQSIPELREIVIGIHQILYVAFDDELEVFAVFNGRQDLRRRLSDLWRRN